MTAPASLPPLVGYTIDATLGASAPGGSEALASVVRNFALGVLNLRGADRADALDDFHGRGTAHLKSLGLLPHNRSVMAELSRVAVAMRTTLRRGPL